MKLIFISVFTTIIAGISCDQNPITVSFYYEGLCPFCHSLYQKSIYSAIQDFGPLMKLDMIPFGNANFKYDIDHWYFKCQHGEKECQVNRVHSCILELPDVTDQVKFDYIFCNYNKSGSPIDTFEICAQENGINWQLLKKNCIDTDISNAYLVAYGYRTETLDIGQTRRHTPLMAFNGIYNETLDTAANRDFYGTFCKLLLNPKPDICNKYIHNTSFHSRHAVEPLVCYDMN